MARQGTHYAEIAATLGRSINAVRQMFRRQGLGIKQIRNNRTTSEAKPEQQAETKPKQHAEEKPSRPVRRLPSHLRLQFLLTNQEVTTRGTMRPRGKR